MNKRKIIQLLLGSEKEKQRAIEVLKPDLNTTWTLPLPKNVPSKTDEEIKEDARMGLFWYEPKKNN